MVLINPGGPGASGITYVQQAGLQYQAQVGRNWDIVGFDPRGVWQSEPALNCSTANPLASNQKRNTPRVLDDFYDSYIQYGQDKSQACQKTAPEAGQHMSTAVVARDMLSMADAYAGTQDGKRAAKDAKLVNFLGTSYGTFLGQTFASKFPYRVGHMLLDGVVDPAAYLKAFASDRSIKHLDGVIALFFVYCFKAGPAACPFGQGAKSAKDVYARFQRSFSQVDAHLAASKGWANATAIESALAKLKISLVGSTYSPLQSFPKLSAQYLSLEEAVAARDMTKFKDPLGDPFAADYNEAYLWGVLCSDQNGRFFGKTLDDLRPLVARLEKQSIVGETWNRGALACLSWPLRSTDIFQGPFGGKTKNPLLFVSNTYDPVTPIEK